MDGKNLTRHFLLNNYSDDFDATNSDIKNINLVKKKSDVNIIKSNINKNRRYIKKLKESPTIKNYRKSMYQLKQSGGYEEDQDGSGWRDDFYNKVKSSYGNARESFKKNYKKAKDGIKEYESYGKDLYRSAKQDIKDDANRYESYGKELYKSAKQGIKDDAKGYESYGKELYKSAKQGIKDDVKSNVDLLQKYYSNMNKEYDYHNLKRKQAREGSANSYESSPELDELDKQNPKWAAFYEKARKTGYGKYLGGTDSECSRESCNSHKGSGIRDMLAKKASALLSKHASKITAKAEEVIEEQAKKIGKKQKGILKGLLGGKTKELYDYAKTNNKMNIFPQAVGKMILTYGKKHGQNSVMKFGGKLKSLITSEIGGNIDQYGNKLGGEIKELINKHIDHYNNNLNNIANMYADKYPSKYNDLMRKIDFKTDLNNVMKGGDSKALKYSPDLSEDDMISLKMDHSDIKKNINLIDHKIKKLLRGGKKELLSGGSKKMNKIKNKFRELLIQRRILIDELVDLELKFNSIEKKDVLEDSNQLYQLDKEFRNMADNLGMGFDLDDNTKKAFLNNRQLKLANDTLGDLSKSLNRKLNRQSGGKNIFSYELFISESKVQTGGASKEKVQKQISRVCENYLKLVEIFKINENTILGLDVETNAELLEKLQIFVNKINEIIRNIHIFNSRFTNKVPKEEIDVIAYQMSVYEKDFESNQKELNKLIKFKIDIQSGGIDLTFVTTFYIQLLRHMCNLIKNDPNNTEIKRCLLRLIHWIFVDANKIWTNKINDRDYEKLKNVAKEFIILRGNGASIILSKNQMKNVPKQYIRGETGNPLYDPNPYSNKNIGIQEFIPENYKFAGDLFEGNPIFSSKYSHDKSYFFNPSNNLYKDLRDVNPIELLDDNQLNEILNINYIVEKSPIYSIEIDILNQIDEVMQQYKPPIFDRCLPLIKSNISKSITLSPPPPPPPPPPPSNCCPVFEIKENINENNNTIKFLKFPNDAPATITCEQLSGIELKFDTDINLQNPNTYIFKLNSTSPDGESIECVKIQKIVSPKPSPGSIIKYCPTFKIIENKNSFEILNASQGSNNIQQLIIRCNKINEDIIIDGSRLNKPNESIYKKENLVEDANAYIFTISAIYSDSPIEIPCGTFEKKIEISAALPVVNQCPIFTVDERSDSITITKNGGNAQNFEIISNLKLPGLSFVGNKYTSGKLPEGLITFKIIAIFSDSSKKECYNLRKIVEKPLPPIPPPVINQCPVFRITETSNSIIIDKTGDIDVKIISDQEPNKIYRFDNNNLFTANNLQPGTIIYTLTGVYPNEEKLCGTIIKTVPVQEKIEPVQIRPKQCPNFIVSGSRNKIQIKQEPNSGDEISKLIIKCDKVVDNIAANDILYEGLGEYNSDKLLPNEIYTFSIYVKYSNNPGNPDEEYLCTRIIKNVPPKAPNQLAIREGQCPLFDITEQNKKVIITHRSDTGKLIEKIYVNNENNIIPINGTWTSIKLPVGEHTFIIYTKYEEKDEAEECHKFTLKISDTVDKSNQCPTFTISETENSVKFKHNNDTGKNIKEININNDILPLNNILELNDLDEGENKFNIEVTYNDGKKSICHTYTKNVVKKKKETSEIGTDTDEEEKKDKKNCSESDCGVTIHNNNNPTIMPIINVHVPAGIGGTGGPGGNLGPVQPEKKLTISSDPNSASKIKEGTPIKLTAYADFDTEEKNYLWYINDEEIKGKSGSTITITELPTNPGMIYCKYGETTSNTLIIQIKPLNDNSNLDKIIDEEEEINKLLELLLKDAKKKKSIMTPFKRKFRYGFKAPSAFERPDLINVSSNPVVTASPIVTASPTSISNPVVTSNPTSISNPVSSSNSSSASSSSSSSGLTRGGFLRFKNLKKFNGGTTSNLQNYTIETYVIYQRKIGKIIDIDNENSTNILYKIVFEDGNELILGKSDFILLNQENIEQKLNELKRQLRKELKQPNINFKTVNEPRILNPVVNYLDNFDNFNDYKGPTQSEKKLTEDIITENNPGYNELDKVNYAHINKIFNTTGLNIDKKNENYELIQEILRQTKQSLPIYKRVEGIEEKEINQTGGAQIGILENMDNLELWDKINSMNGGGKYSWTPIQSRGPNSSFISRPSTPETSDDEGEFTSKPNPLFKYEIPPKRDELPEPDKEITEDFSLPPPPKTRNPFTDGPSTPETSDDEGEFTGVNPGYKNKFPNLKKYLESDDNLPEPDEGLPKSDIKLSESDIELPEPDEGIPNLDIRLPKPDVELPKPDEELPEPGEGIPNLDIRLPKPDVELPKPDEELPEPSEGIPEPGSFTPPNEEDNGDFEGINPLQEIKIKKKLEQQLEDENKELLNIKNEIKSVPYINILKRTRLFNRKRELDRKISIIESNLLKLTPSKKEESDEDIATKIENNEKRKKSLNTYGKNPLRKKVSRKSSETIIRLTKDDLEDLNVTSDDGVINNDNLSYIIKKIDNYSNSIEKNNEIDVKQFNTVYFTSDIHSDYVKFVNILKSANIIKFEPDIEITDSNMYNADIITTAKWVPNNTLFIILGDLVDGKRGINNFVNDVKGSSEFLLHALIYNLRIDALTKNSNIIFTLGNHDHHSIILNELSIVDSYATKTSLKFFKSAENRSEALLPFYKCSPYYYIFLKNGDKIEVSGVHGEFIDIKDDGPPINKENFDKLQNLQNRLNQRITNFRQSILETDTNNLLGDMNNSILWARNYAKLNEVNNTSNNCDKLSYPLTVVGHCPTSISNHGSHSFTYISQLLNKRNKNLPSGEKCDTNLEGHRGCVALGCENESDKRPKLAFVDIAMSHAFFEPEEINKDRIIEILKLDHTIDDPNYYYDKISLKIIDNNSSKEEKIWSSSDLQEVERLKKETELEVKIDAVNAVAQNAQKKVEEAKISAQEAQEEAEVANKKAEIAQEEVDAVEADVDSVEKEVDAVQEDVDSVEKEVDAVQEDVDSVEKEVDAVQEDVDSVEKEVDAVQEDVDSVEKEVDAVQEDIDSVEKEVDSVQAEVDAVEEEVDTVQAEVDSVQEDVDAVEEELKTDTSDTIQKEIISFLLNDNTYNDDNILNPDINNIDNDELEILLLTVDMSKKIKKKLVILFSELAEKYNTNTDKKFKKKLAGTISLIAEKYNSG
jgi:predicted  nucleic acid-binding Zn-ribbon protein